MPKLAASVTMLFNEWPLLDRFAQAAAAGFRGVEVQDPYGASKDSVAERVRAHGLKPVLMNAAPAVAAVPGREAEFRAGIERAFAYAAASGCGQLHCLAGVTDAPSAEATFVANLRWAAATAPPGMRILIEPLNTRDNPGYFLTGSAQACRILEQVEADNVFLQFDFYHMQIMEGDLAATVRAHIDAIAHFQVGGVPGRQEPGRGPGDQLPLPVRPHRRPRLPRLGRLRVPARRRHARGALVGTALRHHARRRASRARFRAVATGDGRWAMGDGRWAIDDGRRQVSGVAPRRTAACARHAPVDTRSAIETRRAGHAYDTMHESGRGSAW